MPASTCSHREWRLRGHLECRLFSGGSGPAQWGVFADHPGRPMIDYSPSPSEGGTYVAGPRGPGGLGPTDRDAVAATLGLEQPESAPVPDPAARAAGLRAAGWTVDSIATELGRCRRTMYRYLRRFAAWPVPGRILTALRASLRCPRSRSAMAHVRPDPFHRGHRAQSAGRPRVVREGCPNSSRHPALLNTCGNQPQGPPAVSVFAVQQTTGRGLPGCLQDGWSVMGVAHAAPRCSR